MGDFLKYDFRINKFTLAFIPPSKAVPVAIKKVPSYKMEAAFF